VDPGRAAAATKKGGHSAELSPENSSKLFRKRVEAKVGWEAGSPKAWCVIANGISHFVANAALGKRLRIVAGLLWPSPSCACLR
jgi:hypothetical protein